MSRPNSRRFRLTRALVLASAVGAGLLVIGPAEGTSLQPAPGTHTPGNVSGATPAQPAPGSHTAKVNPGAVTALRQPAAR